MGAANFVDANNLSLDEWLNLVYHNPENLTFLKRAFPSEKHRNEYIQTIPNRTDKEVLKVLESFLIPSTYFYFFDDLRFDSLLDAYKDDKEKYKKMISHTYFQRLLRYFRVSEKIYPWEGNTWILDLLPHSPKLALEALNAYIFAHIPVLPDMALMGLFDAAEVIRAKYIGLPGSLAQKVEFLKELSSRQFEHLVEKLYHEMEYETTLTAPSSDGGFDIIAKINSGAKKEFLLIECKRYTGRVGVEIIRRLYGVVHSEKANRGVLVTNGTFTKGAINYATENSVQLMTGEELVMLLNEYLGANWVLKLDRIIADSEQRYLEQQKKFS